MDVDWSELPSDLVHNIATKLNDYVDYVRLRAVCKKWRSTLSPTPHYLATQFPWLMLRPEPESNYAESHGFFHFLENRIYQLDLPNGRPWRRCCGSSHGWLVLLEERDPVIVLYNPFNRIQIQLPPLTTFANVLDFDIGKVGEEYRLSSSYYRLSLVHVRDVFIKKIVLSSNPDSDFVAVAIVDLRKQLAFCKKGEESWTMITDASFYEDVIYYGGLFYAVQLNASVAIFDVSSPSPLLKVIKVPSPVSRFDSGHGEGLYLVESFGELMMVYRLFRPVRVINNNVIYETVGFKVVRLNSSKTNWVRVKSLGDRMLFLGSSASLCLLASDFNGCEGNRIYFTGESTRPGFDQSYCNHDSGIYNLENCTILELPYCPGQDSFLPPPVWLSPNPFSA